MCCYTPNLLFSKTSVSIGNSQHLRWNLDATFILWQACSHGGHSRAMPPNFVVPRKIWFKRTITTKTKSFPPNNLLALSSICGLKVVI